MNSRSRLFVRRTLVAVAIAFAMALIALVPHGAEGPEPPSPPPPLGDVEMMGSAHHVKLGAFVGITDPHTELKFKRAFRRLEGKIGRKFAIDHRFYDWRDEFPGWALKWDKQYGRTPLVSWKAPDVRKINSGSQDSWIKHEATALHDYGRPVLLAWGWEMDLRTELSRNPRAFKHAWIHLHNLFKKQNATNVRWVWCPASSGFATGEAQRWYPGNAYVDWLCADGFNWGTATNDQWRSFQEVFSAFYSWAKHRDKPLIIGETACMEGRRYWKARWITNARETMKKSMPRIKAFVYFHSKTTAFHGGLYDWRVTTSRSALKSFKRLAHDPYFN
jgi:hypothetical protein